MSLHKLLKPLLGGGVLRVRRIGYLTTLKGNEITNDQSAVHSFRFERLATCRASREIQLGFVVGFIECQLLSFDLSIYDARIATLSFLWGGDWVGIEATMPPRASTCCTSLNVRTFSRTIPLRSEFRNGFEYLS